MPASKEYRVDHDLGIRPDGHAAYFLKADAKIISQLWHDLQTAEGANLRRDFSENGVLILAGRCDLPDAGQHSYWAIRDNRVHFSHRIDTLSEQDKMLLVNQVLVAFAQRSRKDDVKSAALAMSEKGHFFIANNTQEAPTMAWEKECAESNLSRVIKQLITPQDPVTRVYVLGGITDNAGNMHVTDHLLGMCMRCVESVAPVMSADAKVTIIPANDGSTPITLRECDSLDQVGPQEAWQVAYRLLKDPSIIRFPEEVNRTQQEAFDKLQHDAVQPEQILAPFARNVDPQAALRHAQEANGGVALLEANPTPDAVNAFMVAKLARAVSQRHGQVEHMGIGVVEITENNHKRYEYGMEIRGPEDNAVVAPLSTAISQAALPIARADSSAYISGVYTMGYNSDGTPYDMDASLGDRLLKRTGPQRAAATPVTAIPLNDGTAYPDTQVIVKSVKQLSPTGYYGSKQHPLNGGKGCC